MEQMQQKEHDSNKERDHWSQPHLVRNIYIPRTRKIKEIFRLHCKVGKRDLQARDENMPDQILENVTVNFLWLAPYLCYPIQPQNQTLLPPIPPYTGVQF